LTNWDGGKPNRRKPYVFAILVGFGIMGDDPDQSHRCAVEAIPIDN
jgi:hypothetical protein